jgi:dephospho-CoA kinase
MIFLAGPHGAGKTTVAEILAGHNFIYLDLGGVLRKKHQEENPEISFDMWCKDNEKLSGPSFTDDVIVREIEKIHCDINKGNVLPRDLVIVGSRSLKGIKYIIEKIPNFNGCKNFIVYIDAPAEILIRRYCFRESKQLTLDDFRVLLERDIQIGLPSIVSAADIRIVNSGSMQALENATYKLIINQLGYTK